MATLSMPSSSVWRAVRRARSSHSVLCTVCSRAIILHRDMSLPSTGASTLYRKRYSSPIRSRHTGPVCSTTSIRLLMAPQLQPKRMKRMKPGPHACTTRRWRSASSPASVIVSSTRKRTAVVRTAPSIASPDSATASMMKSAAALSHETSPSVSQLQTSSDDRLRSEKEEEEASCRAATG